MQLIGMLDSPYVRRVAISAQFLGIPYDHVSLSIFNDLEKFRAVNPLIKVPTLVSDDGQVLVDSTLIIDFLETICAKGKSLMPQDHVHRMKALQVIGASLVAMEKVVALIYECKKRPEELQYLPWIERVEQQLRGATDQLDTSLR